MKRSLLILSMAGAIALAGCSKTEFVSAPGGTIGFRTSVATATKATDITTATLASFNAYALDHTTGTAYFSDVTFTKGDDNTFTSANEYIWPEGSLDFYAYAPVGNTQVVKGADCKTFTVTPSTTASEQVDFIYANTNGKSKDANADGVAINFRHTESQIALKVKNSSASLKFEVAGWKVAYLSKSGTFTYADTDTDAANTQLAKTDWSDLDEAAVTNTYEQSLTSSVSVAASASTATAVGESFILIPQSQKAAAKYAAATAGSAADGSYIAVKLIIRNAIDNSVIYSDGAATPGAAWAMWPVDFEWEPGKKYTYVVDLSGCGFHETVEGDGDGDTDLDKVYESVPITFVNVTVDEFAAQDDIDVTMPAEEEEASDVLSGVFSVSNTKKVQFTKGNLYYDGSALNFEANQHSSASSWDASHVSHFTWSDNITSAVSDSNSGGNLFCDENHKVSVNGSEAIYYALSKDEWKYLLDNHSKKWAKVNGVKGYVIAPDGFVGTLADSYADDAALAAAGNLVFLPAAGLRCDSDVSDVGDVGDYWSSTADGESCAFTVDFSSLNVYPNYEGASFLGYSVRLITDAGASAPEVISVESVSLNKSTLKLAVGAYETLTATVTPDNATDKSVTWSSSDESVATVDESGKVTAISIGTATITATTTDGSKTATCEVTVASDVLAGVFSVSATKKVQFTKGNLWADGDNALYFEDAQWKSTPASEGSMDESHVSHFTWSSTIADAVGDSYSGDNLFCDENNKVAVDGSEEIYYALSKDEWKYLFNNHSKKWTTVNGVGGYVIAPDGFVGTLADSYADDAALAADNLVFLPAAGYRYSSYVLYVGSSGDYWSSAAYAEDRAYYVSFSSDDVYPDNSGNRNNVFSVRLITDASVTPAPTPTTTGTAKATIGGSEVDVNWVQLWENGPKFAEYNVGSTMTFIDAIKAGAEYEWGANWCTPSKDDLNELLKAAAGEVLTKVNCEYTQVSGTWGFKFTGKETGYTDNSVFFPAQSGDGGLGEAQYWSSTTEGGPNGFIMYLSYGFGDWCSAWYSGDQDSCYLVRPVLRN